MSLPAELNSCPQGQDDSGVAAEARFGIYQRRGLTLGESRPQTLDYKLWAVLENMACQQRHNNLESLKRSIVKTAAEIPVETLRAAIAQWPESLEACVEAEGGHFEWHYYKYKPKTIANRLFVSKNLCSLSFSF